MERSEFEQMARTWREKALSTCRRYGAGQEEAEDIAQDVMLRLWQMHDELERYRSVEAIATLMAKHLLRNHQRRQPTEPHEQLEMKEDENWLSLKLKQMPTTQRTLLYLRQVERRSHEEIATLLGIEVTSVSTLLARARRTLLEEIRRRNQI